MFVGDTKESVPVDRYLIEAENQRRHRNIPLDQYAPWQPAVLFLDGVKKREAARALHQAGVFPRAGDACLEVGFGYQGWLGNLIDWGVREQDLCGIELQENLVEAARAILPVADLRHGDATRLPWPNETFRLVVASMVFTAIGEDTKRRTAAAEIHRVLKPGGGLLWYDIAFDNPRNPSFRKVSRVELRRLFPQLKGKIRSVNLAPPVARFVVPRSWTLAVLLEAIPLIRPFLLAVLIKPC